MNLDYDIVATVGRFQVDDLHAGHRGLLAALTAGRPRKVLVFLGVAPVASQHNPLDYPTRARMVQDAFPEVVVAPLVDGPSDAEWSARLDAQIRLLAPVGRVAVIGGRHSFVESYSGRFPTFTLAEIPATPSGATIRQQCGRQVRHSTDFRAGVIYGQMSQPARWLPTVALAALRGDAVLLLPPAAGLAWRFPGGKVLPTDASLEAAATRTLHQQTRLHATTPAYVQSTPLPDWRIRPGLQNWTTFFTATALGTAASPTATWVPRSLLTTLDFAPGHDQLAAMLAVEACLPQVLPCAGRPA